MLPDLQNKIGKQNGEIINQNIKIIILNLNKKKIEPLEMVQDE
jgi:hypothetical protein